MPAMPRLTKKDQKIYEKIMGVPPNKIDEATAKQKENRRTLDVEDTSVAR